MKNLLLAITLALVGCTAASAATTEECCMNPLDEFTNSPRRWRNDDGSEVVSSSLVTLGPGITASRPGAQAGEPTFVTLDAPGVASLQTLVALLEARVAALEAVVAIRDGFTYLKNPQGQIVITLGQDSGQRTLAFFDGQNPQPQITLDPNTATTQDIAFELNAKNLTVAP